MNGTSRSLQDFHLNENLDKAGENKILAQLLSSDVGASEGFAWRYQLQAGSHGVLK